MFVRTWKAKINGIENEIPWFAEYFTAAGNYGDESSIVKIVPPKECTSFKTGDYIEATVELLIFPSTVEDYYGSNKNLISALRNKPQNWQMVYREAVENDIKIIVSKVILLDNYPIKIEADNSEALFSVTGGIGYVPLTIIHVDDYKSPKLFRKINGKWEKVNQEVLGNDFWQTEYHVANHT